MSKPVYFIPTREGARYCDECCFGNNYRQCTWALKNLLSQCSHGPEVFGVYTTDESTPGAVHVGNLENNR